MAWRRGSWTWSRSGSARWGRCGQTQRDGRTLTLLPREQQQVLAQRHIEQRTAQSKARYDVRAGAEGTISQAVRRTGIRRSRYTALTKAHLGHVFAVTAINIIRLDAWLTGTPLGKTRTSHLAALDLAA
ncbi:transposase [Kitasatospora sp. GAS204B]|nr:transposase [Kitasatospora sp. GAS204B]